RLQSQYFGAPRDINPAAKQFPARFVPVYTDGCNSKESSDDYLGKNDGPSAAKQDDTLRSDALAYYKRVAKEWKKHDLYSNATYAKSPFDEPTCGDQPSVKKFCKQFKE